MGKVVGAEQELRAAVRDAERIESLYTLIAGKSYLADAYALRGKLHRAASLYQEAIEDGLARNDGKPMPLNGYAYSGWGQILYEQNDLNTAESKLNTALELGELLSDWTIVRRALPSLARLQQATRRADAAEASWHKAFELAQEYGDQPGAAYLEALRAHMWLVQAAWESDNAALAFAHRWAASYRAEQHRATDYRATLAQMTLAWAETTQGQADEAATRLERVAEAAQTDGRTDCLIRALACLALAQGQLGQTAESQSTLRRAVELAAPEGYCRTFVDYGPPMHDLLKQLADNHPELAYATRLPGTFPSQIGTTSSTALDEPLNEREQAVLRLIAAGLSNREIADELYLSVNTIKWYTTQIYGKLAVSKRAEAVDRAHDLGIL
jgi:LuxR family maltose regulon positive regulatory protein